MTVFVRYMQLRLARLKHTLGRVQQEGHAHLTGTQASLTADRPRLRHTVCASSGSSAFCCSW